MRSSSLSSTPYEARWYNQAEHPAHPLVSLRDYDISAALGEVLYGEGGWRSEAQSALLSAHDGANVYVHLPASARVASGSQPLSVQESSRRQAQQGALTPPS